MFKYAQIINNKVHWIFESEETLTQIYEHRFSKEIVLVNITNNPEVKEGWYYDGSKFIKPNVVPHVSLDEIKQTKIEELRKTAEEKYIGGFYSSALGDAWYYDSTEEDQRLIEGLYNRTKEQDWDTIERYPGVVPAGYAPIRVKARAEDSDYQKVIKPHNKEQLINLGRDLEKHLYSIKVKHWGLQDLVNASKTVQEVEAISWE